MIKILITLLFCLPLWAQPGCANLSVLDVGPTWVTLRWQGTGIASTHGRIRYGLSAVTENTQGHLGTLTSLTAGNYFTMSAGGLLPNTEYQFEAALSGNGSTWCTGLTTTQTTLPMPATTDPAPPDMSGMNPHVEPTQTGTVRDVTTCNDLEETLNAAVPGDTVRLDASLRCLGSNSSHLTPGEAVWHFNIDGRVGGWQTMVCEADTDICTKTAHGLSDNAEIRFGAIYNYPNAPRPIDFSRTYFVDLVNANEFRISLTFGGAAIDLTTDGTGASQLLFTTQLTCVNPVLVTSTGSNFPPAGVRTNPDDYDYAQIVLNGPNSTRTFDLSYGGASCVIFRNIQFEFDNETSPTAFPDPRIEPIGFQSRSYNWDITFDRVVVKAATNTERMVSFTALDGYRNAIVNSHIEGMNMWVPRWRATAAFTSTTISYSGGDKTAYIGTATPCTGVNPSVEITSGTASGTAFVSLNPADCTVQVDGPVGLGITCTGCTYNSSGLADWPVVSSRYSRVNMSRATITSGAFVSHTDAFAFGSYGAMGKSLGEASSAVATVTYGPGKFWFENNYVKNSFGILIYSTGDHYDSTEGGTCAPTDCPLAVPNPINFLVRRNRFYFDPAFVYSEPEYNLLGDRGGRNVLEWKNGKRIAIEGNIIDGNPVVGVNISAPAVTLTPLAITAQAYLTATTVQDVLVRNNTFKRVGMGVVMTGRYPGGMAYGGYNTRRVKIANNNIATDATEYFTSGFGSGEFIRNNGAQLVSVESNTVTALKGQAAQLFNIYDVRQGGMRVLSNIFSLNDDDGYQGAKWSDPTPANPTYNNYESKQAFDAVWGGYQMRDNAMICGWSTSETETELNQAACDALHDDANDWRDITGTLWAAGSTVAARRDAAKFLSFSTSNLRLHYTSPFIGKGADQDVLERAQGKVTGISARLTAATTLALDWTAPDNPDDPARGVFQCWGEIRSDAGAFVSRTQAAQTTRRQGVSISGLSAATPYRWRILCEAEQLEGRFKTQ